MNVAHLLDQFEATLKNQLAQIRESAKSAAPGGVGEWEEVVTHFGLTGPARADRVKQAGQRGHTRGAFPEEFEAVVGVLGRQASQVLQQMQSWHGPALAADPATVSRLQTLAGKIQQLASEQRKAYEDETKPKTGVGGIAGIFANANATAKLAWWKDIEYDEQLTLACPGCGSPQRTRLNFDCEYCGASMFGPKA